MKNISSNAKLRKRKSSALQNHIFLVVFFAIFLGVIGFLGFQNLRMYQKRVELSNIAKDIKEQIVALEQRKLALQAGIVEVESVEYQEKVLREQGLYQKPGEEVVTILPLENSEEETNQETKRVWWNPTTWFK
ncbi:MAG: hypothetical protein A3B24_02650 [Candidatus Wildermuthbacteria bacterium RIFCSPLOWO2_01_FULL_48_16]|uniref:Cell division protein FtsL n=1 Tax=Candidatus Wildermuthbacteria bacterium RIFCSPLOWO2_01_FULL_48_16 TaxID=1802461 RepID=A0A1G2RJB9_9BACT|nr:MAG: hypothetical protein A3B24_02650 [Candidatus Wildermuthbacteria bacterium RIFCSPLOWO2_01_FULL_48_16]